MFPKVSDGKQITTLVLLLFVTIWYLGCGQREIIYIVKIRPWVMESNRGCYRSSLQKETCNKGNVSTGFSITSMYALNIAIHEVQYTDVYRLSTLSMARKQFCIKCLELLWGPTIPRLSHSLFICIKHLKQLNCNPLTCIEFQVAAMLRIKKWQYQTQILDWVIAA